VPKRRQGGGGRVACLLRRCQAYQIAVKTSGGFPNGDGDCKCVTLREGIVKRHLLRFESKQQPLLSRRAFAKRVARNVAAAAILIGLSLLGGMAGYRYCEGMAWIDAFVNAAMILSGMGPVGQLETWGGKLFAGLYAIYSGLALILATGIIAAPIVHRLLHRFHLESEKE
jgi:hypothetical protein